MTRRAIPCPVCDRPLKLLEVAAADGCLGCGDTCACGTVWTATPEGDSWRVEVVGHATDRPALRVIKGGLT